MAMGKTKVAKKKMMRGGVAQKKMRGGGMAKMAKKKKPTIPKLPGSGSMNGFGTPTYALGPDNSTRVSRSDLKKKRPGSGRIKKMMRGGVAKKK